MQTFLALGLAAQAFAAAIPDGRDGTSDEPIVRPIDLPEFPGSGGITWPGPTRPDSEKRDTIDLGDVTQGTPNPDEVQIVGLTYGGTGCPSSTVSSILSDDRTIMTLIFDEYVASIGPDVEMTENRKNCQLNINLRYPSGFQYSIFSADYRGYAYLEEGVTGTQKSTYYFSGQLDQTSTATNWTGPYDDDFLLHDEAASTSTVWSPCGENGALNINSQLRLTTTDPEASGQMANDSLDTSFRQVVHVKWQECTEES
ncbi:hypothetical protein FQN54_002453 [Arachnomyces sp. PD_36]|nr:hypothetical protein FQN54_002453 [Arachnomyces sp. PD_36]